MTGRDMGVTYRYLQTCLTLCASFAVLISALEMEEEKKRGNRCMLIHGGRGVTRKVVIRGKGEGGGDE